MKRSIAGGLTRIALGCALAISTSIVAADTKPTAANAGAAEIEAANVAVAAAKAELAALRPQLEAGYAVLNARVRAMPRERFDSSAIVELVGRDPAKLTAWVSTETALLPYRGALRGPRGVLMDRGGNSLDRSLLLAEMLTSAGWEVRLARAKLSPEQSEPLASRITSERTQVEAPDLTDPARLARDRIADQAAKLLKWLEPVIAPQAPAFADALSDHWWVQRKQGEQWIDHDVCGVPALPSAAQTVPAGHPGGRLALESGDCAEVVMTLVVESFKDGKLTSDIVMQQTLRPAEMFDRPILLSHFTGTPAVGVPDAGEALTSTDQAVLKIFKSKLVEQTTFVPLLKVGQDQIHSASFNIFGEIDRTPQIDNAGMIASAQSKVVGNAFGGLTGDSGPAAKPDVLTAEWIEYEIRMPGEPASKVRRMVFDLVGPAARAAGMKSPPVIGEAQKIDRALVLLGQTQISFQACDIPVPFAAYQASLSVMKEKAVYLDLTRGDVASKKDLMNRLDRIADVDVPQLVAMARSQLSPASRSTFIDRPNIIHHRTWGLVQPDGTIGTSAGMDLAFMSTAALSGEPRKALADRVTQGVADTLAEHWPNAAAAVFHGNTFRLFELAGQRNVAPIVVRAPADLAPLALVPDVQARAVADLTAGYVLVVVSVDKRSGWWRVDPRSGQTVGVMDDGYHADTSEYPAMPAGPLRAQTIRNRVGPGRFNKMSRDEYLKITRDKSVPEGEWAMFEQLQGKIAEKTLTAVELIARGKAIPRFPK